MAGVTEETGMAAASRACCSLRRGFLGKLAALGAAAMLPGEL